jgi:hypothetical protein
MGAFEAHEDEIDVGQLFVAQVNGTLMLYARQIYARDGHFVYKLAHNPRIMRGFETLKDQTTLPSAD